MEVTYLEHMGTDLSVVNAARVSFDKESVWERSDEETKLFTLNQGDTAPTYLKLSEADTKLINYLAKNNHWSPFAHPQVSIRVKAPIFVARQLAKHQVGFAWNEVSRRYVDSEPEFYEPEAWRAKADNVKQGSSDVNVKVNLSMHETGGEQGFGNYTAQDLCVESYKYLLRKGVCPEQARMVLPQSMYTEWIWTGSLLGWSRVCKLRLDSHTQKETQEVAQMINDIVEPLFPVSWLALSGGLK